MLSSFARRFIPVLFLFMSVNVFGQVCCCGTECFGEFISCGFTCFFVGGGNNGTYPNQDACESACQPLPVDFISFEVEMEKKNKVKLYWSTATEVNNKGFEIERSGKDLKWEVIGFIDGHGDSERVLEYTYVDENPQYGVNYYRLKQIDYDGATGNSRVLAIDVKRPNSIVDVYPNPTSNYLIFDFYKSYQQIEVYIYDITGNLILEEKGKLSFLDVGSLNAGQYIVKINMDNKIITKRFTKVNY